MGSLVGGRIFGWREDLWKIDSIVFFLSFWQQIDNCGGHVSFRLGKGCKAWKWRRRLFAWEEELGRECCTLLLPIVLLTCMNDMLIWQLHATSKYNVISAYNFLTSRDQPWNNDHNTIIWYKEVHLKVNIFAWGLLRNCLQTTDNLIRRTVLLPNTLFCSDWCGSREDIDHMFLTCDYFDQIWCDIYNWPGLVSVTPAHVNHHIN